MRPVPSRSRKRASVIEPAEADEPASLLKVAGELRVVDLHRREAARLELVLERPGDAVAQLLELRLRQVPVPRASPLVGQARVRRAYEPASRPRTLWWFVAISNR